MTARGMANTMAYNVPFNVPNMSGMRPNFGSNSSDPLEDCLQGIGLNPGNQRNSPFFVHMAAGLGTGLFLFDQYGCPVNPLDDDPNRIGCDGDAPVTTFDLARVRFNLDRIVDGNGVSMGSNSHPVEDQAAGATMRVGATDATLAGPLGRTTIERLTDPTTGIVLDAWLDADGAKRGDAPTLVPD